MSTVAQPSQRTCVKPPCRLLGPTPLCIFLLDSALWTFTSSYPRTLNSFSLTGQDLGILLGPCFHKQTKNKENKNKECYEVHLMFPFSRLRTQCCLFSSDWKQHVWLNFPVVLVGGHVSISYCQDRNPICTFPSIHIKSWKLTIY